MNNKRKIVLAGAGLLALAVFVAVEKPYKPMAEPVAPVVSVYARVPAVAPQVTPAPVVRKRHAVRWSVVPDGECREVGPLEGYNVIEPCMDRIL